MRMFDLTARKIMLCAAQLLLTPPVLTLPCAAQKQYFNQTWDYCVNAPQGWIVEHPLDEYGIAFHHDTVSMSFGVIKDEESLDENFSSAYLTDTNVKVIRREATSFQGRAAIHATLEQKNDSTRAREVMTVSGDAEGTFYVFELSAPNLTLLKQHLPVFDSELKSFKFRCK